LFCRLVDLIGPVVARRFPKGVEDAVSLMIRCGAAIGMTAVMDIGDVDVLAAIGYCPGLTSIIHR
jgi:hypothetical protein